jgi:2,3-bisphosphoglycerate-dependent phosphoglycerate mutase
VRASQEVLAPVAEDLTRTTQIVLVRHGLPVTGVSPDPPLSAQGRQQARQAGDWLQWEAPAALISSPSQRALETARAIGVATGLSVEVDEDLREWSEPVTHYITPELLGASERGRAFAEGRFAEFVPKHDREGLTRKMTAAVARAAHRWPGRTVVLVSHGGAINNLFAHVLDLDQPFFFNPGYTSLSRLQAMPSGRLVPTSVNETSHLVAVRTTATPLILDEEVA